MTITNLNSEPSQEMFSFYSHFTVALNHIHWFYFQV